ncbi:Pimeloyl-ACP methyl ester carboxylesterase [Haladaptatus litoreus]|uniref:Pimeloyl-ACP methyl ester carboxylesterase n=1 Tax=Haladaptatus litoreus TaxID=553468 RepID=A0A1N6ZGX8_9EURY|nr:alpha/beta hydrolase [Haladaptatus litoreus]SIR26073.1 Pimeloyl-ACP methyl ester carboxylesterase [Haladaptatus litoreus]
MNVHFEDTTFDYQTLRAMSYATYGGAEPGECLTTVENIGEGNFEEWFTEWRRTADRVAETARDALDGEHHETARGAFFRAHNYYRTAEFFLDSDDPRRRPTYERSRETFRSALDLLDNPVEQVEIPYEDTTLPGYWFSPETGGDDGDDSSEQSCPTVVCLGGFDSIAEELYFLCGVPSALSRGYSCLVFDGPGQGAPLRVAGLRARPDWEAVVGPVLDFLEGKSAVDETRIALLGASMGGYYAPRAAAFDERVSACIAFDHCFDLWSASAHGQERIAELIDYAPGVVVNALAELGARFDPGARWQLQNSSWVFGTDAASLRRTLREYSLRDVADRITCPTLALAGEDDHLIPLPLVYEFVDAVSGPTTLRVFTAEEGAGEHCQLGNLSLAHGEIYDWLDERFSDV